MNKPAHTPGPWKIDRGGGHEHNSIHGSESIHVNGHKRNSSGISSASYSTRICENLGWLDLPGPLANARLIAAAPELLEACKAALIGLEQLESDSGTLGDQLRQAIAKAEGRESS